MIIHYHSLSLCYTLYLSVWSYDIIFRSNFEDLEFAHGQKPQGAMAKAAKLRNLLKLKLLFWQVIRSLVSGITWKLCAVFVHLNHHLFVVRLFEVVSSFSGAFGTSEIPWLVLLYYHVLLMIVGYIIAAPRSWSILKWFKTHSNHQSCLEHLRRTLNTWRLTPHVSRWNIEKVLETALSLIPLYPKHQIPWRLLKSSHPVASSHPQTASTRRWSSPLHGIFARQGQGMQNHQPRKLLRGPSLQGLGRGWEDGRRWTWRGETLEVGETIKTVEKQYRIFEYSGTPGSCGDFSLLFI